MVERPPWRSEQERWMTEASAYLDLAEWRRRVASLYADVRRAPAAGRVLAWHEWRAARNDLFRQHSQSPLSSEQRANFRPLAYLPHDPLWRFTAKVEPDLESQRFHYQLGPDGDFGMKRIGWVTFKVGTNNGRLALYWIEGYGGGLFLPFRDATNGRPLAGQGKTYGGGRYLFDTIKGADLGREDGGLVLDFNYAYNPSCAYHSKWVCPLAPHENTLTFAVRAGEKQYSAAATRR
jgi:uncharacterized protein (DUF1684 family)